MAESPKGRSVTVVSPTLPGVTDEPAEPEGTVCPSGSPPKIMPELDDSVAASDLLTTTMIAEEEEMKKKTENDQERLLQEHQESCGSLSEDLREQRYKRLQFLLSKSNMYTNYLLERMEKQAEEEKEKQERREKKRLLKEEKVKQENKEVRASSRSTRTKVEPAPAAAPAPSRKRKAPGSEQTSKKRRKKEVEEDSDEDELSSPTSQSTTDSQESTTVTKETGDAEKDAEQDGDSKRAESFLSGLPEEDEQPELLTGGTLRPYQMEGYKWLKVLYENGVNGILADEMGLGKTIQCISAVADMCAHAVPGPFLVVAPLSVVPNWVNEFKRFAPTVPVILYHGTKDDRARLRRKINRTYECKPGVRVQPVVVTSYEVTMNDRASLANFPWKYLIVDEGHRIKNSQCRLIKELKMYSSTHRLLLTGTPLQNNLAELWSLLNFLLPEIFDDLASFETWFDLTRLDNEDNHKAIVAEEQRDQVLTMLHQILLPFMLRRMKCDVELDVPPKSEVIVYAPLSNEQTVMYKAALENTIEEMLYEEKDAPEEPLGRGTRERKKVDYNSMCDTEEDEAPPKEGKKKHEDDLYAWCDNFIIPEPKSALDGLKRKKRGNGKTEVYLQLRNKLMLMRKICNHPYLISYPLTEGGEYLMSEAMVKECGKMQLLDQMLTELLKQGHKVLVFSQMTSMLDIIGDYLYYRGLNHSRLDGSMPFQERMVQIDQFNQDADVSVFLLSTRAGGLGLNLTAADTVIIYDSDWNPQCDLQAQDRCHRIGQTKPVVIYRLVTSHTIDQRIVERAAAKRKLEKMVIIKGKFKNGIQKFDKEMKPLTAEELMELLESKDFQAKVEIQKKRGKDQAISQKDLLKLLDRSHLWRQWEEKKRQRAEIAKGVKKGVVDKVKEEEVEEEEEEHALEGVFKTIETTQY